MVSGRLNIDIGYDMMVEYAKRILICLYLVPPNKWEKRAVAIFTLISLE